MLPLMEYLPAAGRSRLLRNKLESKLNTADLSDLPEFSAEEFLPELIRYIAKNRRKRLFTLQLPSKVIS